MGMAMLWSFRVDAAAGPDDAVGLGRRLYLLGIDSYGEEVVAESASGQRVMGPQARCVTCHRPSGFGSSEGGVYAPPVTGPILFQPRQLDRNRLFPAMFEQVQPPGYVNRIHQPHMRPAYTTASLGTLLRTGEDPSGASMSTMPHYALTENDVTALAAYLATLSAMPAPGVDDQRIHFATIVTDTLPPARKEAVVNTIAAYFKWTNQHAAGDRSRPNFSPLYRSDFVSSYREWVLDVWQLTGSQATWRAQLETYLAAQPVFAAIGGLVDGPWREIGHFCDIQRLPCLFPVNDLPTQDDGTNIYSVHFSAGLMLEARAMVAFLSGRRPEIRTIRQIAGRGPSGSEPAATLAAELARRIPNAWVETVPVPDDGGWDAALAVSAGPVDALVIWPGQDPEDAVRAIQRRSPTSTIVLLASPATSAAQSGFSGALAERVMLMHPTELPTVVNPLSFRVRGWLHARGLAIDEPELQFKTYYALSVLDAAMSHLLLDFQRDYLIEWVEHEAEGNLNPGIYPTLSLGPQQRHASRGTYVVKLDPAAEGGIRAVSDWIVP
jgi:mono/diheme cytochrome c family protein